MSRAVVALTAPDLLSHASAGCSSLCAVDNIPFRVGTAAVVLVEVLRAHFEDLRLMELNRVSLMRDIDSQADSVKQLVEFREDERCRAQRSCFEGNLRDRTAVMLF
ncbi:hypothetical protein BDV27DRAFT_120669 [Aspergillus caelatus]|uniref:Uncharacterized protein n=1 Tax=Aspergillus caelatus TaxID=61420 RepID=A0A5N7AHV2_9EURO|nr:uncharacterized protein BDV27DRAFT_120669 [Aspergillus caelatus]KAE8369461.1 hypothetical protein BDV27DRAFT_120669 [Aspergillus caelatus]